MASPCGYHCRRAPRHAFVEIFEVLWSDGPPDLLCDFEDSRHGRPLVIGELFGYLSMGKAILMKDNYRFLLPRGYMGHNENKIMKENITGKGNAITPL